MNSTYCDLKPLHTFFNNKSLYQCNYCGLTVALDDPNTEILCFKKMEDISRVIHNLHTENNTTSIFHVDVNSSLGDTVLTKIQQDTEKLEKEEIQKYQELNNPNNLCSSEQIEQRLAICNTCEYFKNNSCLLCGCTIVREANYQNKLAHKDQKCPADKWGIIED
jgi:hypothetical protein